MSDEILREGSQGETVRALQQRLVDLGHDLAVDGDFGPRTEAVVKAYQAACGLVDDGIVGPKTWLMLDIGGFVGQVVDYVQDVFTSDHDREESTEDREPEPELSEVTGVDVNDLPLLRKGAQGEYVEFLHRCLPYAGFTPEPEETDRREFGDFTEEAVKLFQGDHELVVDGLVGPRTWRKLLPFAGVLPREVDSLDEASLLRPELKPGESGGWVTYLQQMIWQLDPGAVPVSGVYDDATEQFVRHIQRESKLLVVDGTVAEDTWKTLELLVETKHRPPEVPETAEPDEPALPPPTRAQVQQGGELLWPLIEAAHEDAKWFASREDELAKYDGSEDGKFLLLGVGKEGMKAVKAGGVNAYAEKFHPLGLIYRGLIGYGRETEFLLAWPRISLVINSYERAFTSALMNALNGTTARYMPEDYILQAVQAEVYEKISRASAEQRHWMRTWIEEHDGIDSVMLMRDPG